MLHRKWFLNTVIGRFLRVEVGTGFPGRRNDVCKGTELSDGRKSSGLLHITMLQNNTGGRKNPFSQSQDCLVLNVPQVVQCKK